MNYNNQYNSFRFRANQTRFKKGIAAECKREELGYGEGGAVAPSIPFDDSDGESLAAESDGEEDDTTQNVDLHDFTKKNAVDMQATREEAYRRMVLIQWKHIRAGWLRAIRKLYWKINALHTTEAEMFWNNREFRHDVVSSLYNNHYYSNMLISIDLRLQT